MALLRGEIRKNPIAISLGFCYNKVVFQTAFIPIGSLAWHTVDLWMPRHKRRPMAVLERWVCGKPQKFFRRLGPSERPPSGGVGVAIPSAGEMAGNVSMSLIHLCVTRPLTPPVEGTDLVIFSDIKNYVAQWDNQNFLASCKKYAQSYGVYLLTSRVVADGYLCLFLFDDKGKIIGGQRAVSLNLSYLGTLSRSTDLNIVRTKFGNLFLAVDVDIYRPEILRAAALSGAEIILSPSGSLTPRQESLADWGYKAAADALAVYIAAPVLSGTMGVRFCGRAACYGPLNITKERDGIVNQVICDDAGGLIVSRLNLEQLYAGFDAYTGDSNPEFIKTQLMSAYQKLTKRL